MNNDRQTDRRRWIEGAGRTELEGWTLTDIGRNYGQTSDITMDGCRTELWTNIGHNYGRMSDGIVNGRQTKLWTKDERKYNAHRMEPRRTSNETKWNEMDRRRMH
jgi:hypothetical protein